MRALSIAIHILLGLGVLFLLVRQLGVRAQEVSDVRGLAAQEHLDTVRMAREAKLHQELLTAIRAKDPYVIELLARDRYSYSRSGELSPPPLPTANKR